MQRNWVTSMADLGFADDVFLMAESRVDFQALLQVCSTWARENQMEFGLKKCAWIQLHGPKDVEAEFYLEVERDGKTVKALLRKAESYLYLGLTVVQPRLPSGWQYLSRERAAAARILEMTHGALSGMRNRSLAAGKRFSEACTRAAVGRVTRAQHFQQYVGAVMDQAAAVLDLTEDQLHRMDSHERYLRRMAGCGEEYFFPFSGRWAARRRKILSEYRWKDQESWRSRLAWMIPEEKGGRVQGR